MGIRVEKTAYPLRNVKNLTFCFAEKVNNRNFITIFTLEFHPTKNFRTFAV